MRQIIYMSRERAEEFLPPVNSAILSIYTPNCKPAKLHASWESVKYWAREDNEHAMLAEDVSMIWAWVEENKHRNLYVHCDAGISRSGGVAHAIALYLNAKPVPLEMRSIRRCIDMLNETDEMNGTKHENTPASLVNTRIKADLIRHLWEKRLVVD